MASMGVKKHLIVSWQSFYTYALPGSLYFVVDFGLVLLFKKAVDVRRGVGECLES